MSSYDVGDPWNASSFAPVAERHVERRPERLDEREAVVADLRARPLAHGELALGRSLLPGVRVEQERVGVAEHDRAAELAQTARRPRAGWEPPWIMSPRQTT